MTDRPIIFSAPMIRALLEERKTQTRRILKPQPEQDQRGLWHVRNAHGGVVGIETTDVPSFAVDYVPWSEGDRLWVRETWKPHSIYAGRVPRDIPHSKVFYRADDGYAPSNTRWVPPIHMPRWASRLTLIVEGVKVEQLQDISEEDAKAEGAGLYVPGHGFITEDDLRCDPGYSNYLSPRLGFEAIWHEINGPDSWAANPWVAAITFRVVKSNIDALAKEAA